MGQKEIVNLLLKIFPQTYSEELGIDLKDKKPKEIFKWFLASILFGARIGENIVKKTYKEFKRRGYIKPQKILDAGWDSLVEALDAGSYTRYDFSTATALLEIMKKLLEKYGSLENLYKQSKDTKDLENKLQEFKRVGPTTVNIFLRELRGIWKVDPLPSKFTILAAKKLNFIKSTKASKALEELKQVWNKNKFKGKNFTHFETALLRLGKDYCNKGKCKACPFSSICLS